MDYFDPRMIPYETDAYGWMTATCSGGGGGKLKAVEWFHASSATEGADGNYLITSRNLDALVSLHKDGSGVQWVLASDPRSVGSSNDIRITTGAVLGAALIHHNENVTVDLASRPHSWARAAGYTTLTFDGADGFDGAASGSARHARFYQPHDVVQYDAHHVLLVDDGKMRPNCTTSNTLKTCFSRAVECAPHTLARRATLGRLLAAAWWAGREWFARDPTANDRRTITDARRRRRRRRPTATTTCALRYKLDFDAGTASLVWEFEYPMDGIDDDGDDVARSESGSLAKEERYDIFNTAGGSVAKMDNGAYFVAFNAAEVSEGTEGSHPTLAFEVSPKGRALSKVRLPRISVGCGSYRTLTSDSVFFESDASSLTDDEEDATDTAAAASGAASDATADGADGGNTADAADGDVGGASEPDASSSAEPEAESEDDLTTATATIAGEQSNSSAARR